MPHGRWPVRRHAYGASGGNNDCRKSRSVCQKAAGKRGQFESLVVECRGHVRVSASVGRGD